MQMESSAILRELTTQTVAVIGDVHGHVEALENLLGVLEREAPDAHLAFVGDVSHKGPESVATYRMVLELLDSGRASLVASNHGVADGRHLGQAVSRTGSIVDAAVLLYDKASKLPAHATMWHVAKLAGDLAGVADGDELAERIIESQRSAPLQARFGEGLVVVHGGLTSDTFGSQTRRAQQTCLYGTPTGMDERGRPLGRDSWVESWCRSRDADASLPAVAYGHISYLEPRVTAATIGVDTGCGSSRPDARLTAALWTGTVDSVEFVSVPAPLPGF